MGLTGDADDVRTAFLDAAESLGGAGNGLVDDDGLHGGVVREVDYRLDGGLKLFGEVVGVDGQLDHVLAVHRLEGLRAAAVVLRLGDGAGDYTDMDVIALGRAVTAGAQCKHHAQGKKQCYDFFHVCPP